ncbi:cyclic nucleotide-binding domain-containing protein [Streptomyces erythrochromogenes]|uniref:regulator n=1 Tax=Streptomyces erythrochromogenes TaxID=285574 RepID=UPI00381A422E
MRTTPPTKIAGALPAEHRSRLMGVAREADFPESARLNEWMLQPRARRLGAVATTPVRTYEFDAAAVRTMMDTDPAFGSAMGHWVAQVLAHRLHAARVRLLDLHAPHGSGSRL